MRRLSRAGIAVVASAVLAGLLPAPAVAQGATFSITPTTRAGYFIFNSAPGSVIHGQVHVVNVSSVSGQAKLYAVDATTGQTSGAVYQSQTAPRRSVGSWIKLASTTVSLGPHGGTQVGFTVDVPAGATAGQHLGGLVVAPIKATATSTAKRGSHTFHVNINEIAVVAVQVNLPGALVRKIGITGVSASGRPGYQTLLIGLSNTGNALVKGSGTIVASQGSRRVLSQSFPLDTMVPSTSIDYPVYVRGARLAPGSYTADVNVSYQVGHHVHGTFVFVISSKQVRQTYGSTVPSNAPAGVSSGSSSVPAWAIGLGALALVAVSIGGSALYFRRRSAS